MANVAVQRLGRFMILVQNRDPASDVDWQMVTREALALRATCGGDITTSSTLIFTDGGSPSAKHRRDLADDLKGQPAPTVVISDNMMSRAIVAVVSLVNPGVKSFGSKDWKAAFARAQVPVERHTEFLEVARRLATDVGGSQVIDSIWAQQT